MNSSSEDQANTVRAIQQRIGAMGTVDQQPTEQPTAPMMPEAPEEMQAQME